MKVYNNLDLQNNELKNALLDKQDDISKKAVKDGQIIFDISDNHIKVGINKIFEALALKKELPIKVSDLLNDIDFQTKQQVDEAIASADFSKFIIVDELPDPAEAKEKIFYLTYNINTQHYDIYAKIDDKLVWIDDTTIDLSEYVKTTDMNSALDNKVDKEDGWGLSQENFSYEDEIKLSTIEEGADVNVIEAVKVNGAELPVAEEDKSVNINITVYSKDSTKYIFARDSKDNGLNLEIITKEGD